MTTKRPARGGPQRGRSTKTATDTKTAKTAATKSRPLDPLEEKVLRMRAGRDVPDDMPLGRVGQENESLRARLRAIEERALVKSGRLDSLREEAGLSSDGSEKKKKIIESLKAKKPPKETTKSKAGASSKRASARKSR